MVIGILVLACQVALYELELSWYHLKDFEDSASDSHCSHSGVCITLQWNITVWHAPCRSSASIFFAIAHVHRFIHLLTVASQEFSALGTDARVHQDDMKSSWSKRLYQLLTKFKYLLKFGGTCPISDDATDYWDQPLARTFGWIFIFWCILLWNWTSVKS